MSSWWSRGGDITRRLHVLRIEGWCPHCGAPLLQPRGGARLGAVAGECAVHGTIESALTA